MKINDIHTKTDSINIFSLLLCALFAAVICVLSWISIPLPFTPVPINFAMLGVLLCASLLGTKLGLISVSLYILMGAVGLPVFSGGNAGIGALIGPTGGFIIGYIFTVSVASNLTKPKMQSSDNLFSKIYVILKLFLSILPCYISGLIWFVVNTNSTIITGMISCVIPFLPGDIFKAVVCHILLQRLKPLMHNFSM